MQEAGGGPRRTHVGVLEFTAEEGKAYVPYWIMQSLLLPEGGYLSVSNAGLPLASCAPLPPSVQDPHASILRSISWLHSR